MASLTPNWRDNAGRRGNKRERIKRVPFNSRVRFHNSDPEGSVRSVWKESARGAVDLARMPNTYACIYMYIYICEYNSRGDGPRARSLTSIRSRIKTKPGSLSVQCDTIRAAHALPYVHIRCVLGYTLLSTLSRVRFFAVLQPIFPSPLAIFIRLMQTLIIKLAVLDQVYSRLKNTICAFTCFQAEYMLHMC